MNSGVYEIVNTVNGKRYVGSATSFRGRFAVHRSELRAGKHRNRHLQRAWAKYGETEFSFRPIVICAPCDLLLYEQIAIDALVPDYNLAPKAANCLGVKWSEDARARKSDEQRASPNFLGRKHGPESIALMAERARGNTRAKGKTRNKAAIEKSAAAHRGMKRSDETRARIAAKAVGRKRSPESIEKGAAKLRGRKMSAASRQKLIGNTRAAGQVFSAERRAAVSEKLKTAWAARKAAGLSWKGGNG